MSSRRAKREGTIEAPRGVIRETRETVKANDKHMVITTYECERSITIFIGSSTIYCIDAQLFKANGQIMDTGILTKIRWDSECSTSNPFTKGSDTNMILQLLMTYIKDRYPDVKHIGFTDMSTKRCDNGSSVNLAAMKFLTVGKTWYEDNFHASVDPHSIDIYDNMIKEMNKKKASMSWDKMKQYMETIEIISENDMHEKYDECDTWQKWFTWIYETLKVTLKNKDKAAAKLCIWLSHNNWFDVFLQSVLHFNTMAIKFVLTPKLFDLPYRIYAGGRRNTHKQRRCV